MTPFDESGFSLLEEIVALAIVGIVVAGAISLFSGVSAATRRIADETNAVKDWKAVVKTMQRFVRDEGVSTASSSRVANCDGYGCRTLIIEGARLSDGTVPIMQLRTACVATSGSTKVGIPIGNDACPLPACPAGQRAALVVDFQGATHGRATVFPKERRGAAQGAVSAAVCFSLASNEIVLRAAMSLGAADGRGAYADATVPIPRRASRVISGR